MNFSLEGGVQLLGDNAAIFVMILLLFSPFVAAAAAAAANDDVDDMDDSDKEADTPAAGSMLKAAAGQNAGLYNEIGQHNPKKAKAGEPAQFGLLLAEVQGKASGRPQAYAEEAFKYFAGLFLLL